MAILGAGLAAGLAGMAANALVEDVNYTMVTDLQIPERSRAAVSNDTVSALRQASSGVKLQTSTEEGNRIKYQTRVVSNSNKVNLKFEEAKPVLEAQLAKSVAGIMYVPGSGTDCRCRKWDRIAFSTCRPLRRCGSAPL